MIQEQAVRTTGVHRDGPAYRSGWEDGRFGPSETFAVNDTLASWSECADRLSYYRGHRDGRRVRQMLGVGAVHAIRV